MCAPVPKDKWSWKYDECKRCRTKSKKGKHIHKGRGYCLSCFDILRGLKPKRQAYKKVAHLKWYNKVKGTEEYRKKINEQSLKYRLNSHAYKAFLNKQYLRLKFKRFILKQQNRTGRLTFKREQGGLTFRCDGCSKKCLVRTPIQADEHIGFETESAVYQIQIFKEVQIKICSPLKIQTTE